jgi:hypothetical protein
MIISEKFMRTVEINTPGKPLLHMVLISNDHIPADPALKGRLVHFYLHPPFQKVTRQQEITFQKVTRQQDITFQKDITRTAVYVVILLKYLAFKVKEKQEAIIPRK